MVYYPVQIKSTLEPSSRSQVSYGPIHSAYCRFQTLCLVKERHRNKTKEQKSPNEWARFVEEKSQSIKIAHQMFWKIISAAPKKRKKKEKRKKETKFYFEGCVPRTSPLIFLKNHLSCLFHSSLEVNRFRECTAAIETFRRRTETACSVSALLVYFNQKALKLRKKLHFAWFGIWCAWHGMLFWPLVECLKTFAGSRQGRLVSGTRECVLPLHAMV